MAKLQTKINLYEPKKVENPLTFLGDFEINVNIARLQYKNQSYLVL